MLVLAKALNQKFAHQAGYVLIDGRWKKSTPDMKGTKHAPKAAHPKAGGSGHKPFAMPEQDASKLLYPAEKVATNKDIASFNNKHVPNLLSHAAKGDAAAILGSSYGVNTHGKKLALIANFLLEMMGSKEQVVAGQKAGEHPAILNYEREPETVEQMVDQAVDAVVAEAKTEAKDQPVEEKPVEGKPGDLVMPDFESGKNSTGVRTAYELQANKILAATDLASLEAVQTNAKSWAGKTPNSKKLLNLYGQALAKLKGENPSQTIAPDVEPTPAAAMRVIANSIAQPDTAEGQPAPKASVSKKAMEAINWDQFTVADNIKNSKSYNAQIEAIKAAGSVGDINAIIGMTYGVNTYGKKVAKAANNALAALGYPDIKVMLGKGVEHPMLGKLSAVESEQKSIALKEMDHKRESAEGPNNGDTRMGKTGMLVFKDGHWVKQGEDEPSKEQPAEGEYKKGQKLTIHDMHKLPAGSVIQTFDETGKPYLKVMLGHFTAWPYGKKGAVMSKPFQAGQYQELMGAGGTKPDAKGYISGYHHSDHPTELVSLGDNMHISDAQEKTIKSIFNGYLAGMPNVGVYPTGTSIILVGNPEKPNHAMWINEKGDWGGVQALGDYFSNDIYKDFCSGKEPALNIAGELGLLKTEPEKVKNPPQTGIADVDTITESIQNKLNEGQFQEVVSDITSMMESLNEANSPETLEAFNKVDLAAWLIEAMSTAKAEVGHASVQDLPTPPATKAERVPTPQGPELPEFASIDEFEQWMSVTGDKFMDDGESFYGSDEAFANSEAGRKLDKWIDVLNATKKSEIKAMKHQRKKESAADTEYGYWESAFDKLTDAGSISEADKMATDWIKDNGDTPPHLFALSSALSDFGFKDLAAQYHEEASSQYSAWWAQNYPNTPKKPVVSPISIDAKSNLNLQGVLNALNEEVQAGNQADPDNVAHLEELLGNMTLTSVGEAVVNKYLTDIKSKLAKDGPQEGDRKQGKGGMLVFHNGHWILESEKPEPSANGLPGDDITAFKQSLAGLQSNEVDDAIKDFLYENKSTQGSFAQAINTVLAMNPKAIKNAAYAGKLYFNIHGKPEPLSMIPTSMPNLVIDYAKNSFNLAIAAMVATDDRAKQILIDELTTQVETLQGKTDAGEKLKTYLTGLLDAVKQDIEPKKPTDVETLSAKFTAASDKLAVMQAAESYVKSKGDSKEAYIDIVKAIKDPNLFDVALMYMKKSVDLHGLIPDIPKSDYNPDSMSTAEAIDGISAVALVATYTESFEITAAAIDSAKNTAYAFTAMKGYENMKIAEYAVNMVIYLTGEQPAKVEEPVGKPSDEAISTLTAQLQSLKDSYKPALASTKSIAVAIKFLKEHDISESAITTLKQTMKSTGYSEASIDLVVKYTLEDAGEKDVKAADNDPKEGDMKPGADGMLILKNGHWVKMTPDELPLPDFAAAGILGWQAEEFTKILTHVKEGLAAGKQKGVVMMKSDGYFICYQPKGGKIKVHPLSSNEKSKMLGQYVAMLLMAHGKKLKTSWTPEKGTYLGAAASSVMQADASTQNPAENPAVEYESEPYDPNDVKVYAWDKAKKPESVDGWEVTGGNQGGSNEGLKMKDGNGQEWYVKFPNDEDHAKAEVLTAKLYAAAGLSSQDAMVITKDGKMGIASKWEDLKKAKTHAALAKAPGMLDGFAVDAWLGNWDVIGLNLDNVQLKGKMIHRVDAGGSLMFRAQGAKKDFGPEVTELKTLIDPNINPHSAKVFGKMTEEDIAASVVKVLTISDAKIAHMVDLYGPGDTNQKAELVKTLIQRKEYLAKMYPQSLQAAKVSKFDPSKVSAPPDFLNWSGPGKSGPSSVEALNQANHTAAQEIYLAAKTGDVDSIRGLTAPIFDKTTGVEISQVPVTEHPSQHISGYAKQAINEIKSLLNPPETFRLGGDHPLYSLNAAYKPQAWHSNSAAKVGEFLSLRYPGVIKPDQLGLKKLTYQSKTLTRQTYSEQAQAAIAKMPNTQKQALAAYTGSGYKSMNSSLWSGNPSGQAKAAAEAMHTHAHDIAPGTILSRKFSLNSSELAKLKNSLGKVLQEPAIMSTSIRPSSWMGDIQLKMTVGPGVKGLWVGPGSLPDGDALSNHASEDELILPPNTRMLVVKHSVGGSVDADGFGGSASHVFEVIILPSEGY
ncbi:ADP-ribosyltransferase toxin [Yersinia phage fHe-Yen8-01]|nr:ADP-ribosyltransferase toxin [Yersinia phage fHe-Yen8-01]